MKERERKLEEERRMANEEFAEKMKD